MEKKTVCFVKIYANTKRKKNKKLSIHHLVTEQ